MIITMSFIALLLIGFVSLIRQKNELNTNINFSIEYRERAIGLFNKLVRTGEVDFPEHVWLTKNVDHIQARMGIFGVIHYIGPWNRISVPRYQVVLNTMAKINQGKLDDFDVNACSDALLRYTGSLERQQNAILKRLRNPIYWFKEGVQIIISIPIYLLNVFGLLSDASTTKATGSTFVKVIAGIVALVGFLGSLADAVVGRAEVISFFKNLFHK
ncbi:MAG: hypothetical protein ABJC98_13755 [Bacteroidota bacterium]